MPSTTLSPSAPFVLVGTHNGITVIPAKTPLARLNYFDGKFLRAADLTAEQTYLRSLVELSNQAGGAGVVHGYDLSSRGNAALDLGPGLAIDPAGRVLLLPEPLTVGVAELIERTRRTTRPSSGPTAAHPAGAGFMECVAATETTPGTVVQEGDLYLITLAHAEALCGQEDVYGKICEEACITSTARPLRLEGVTVRARPLLLHHALPTSTTEALATLHLRSRVASAFFADEAADHPHLISRAGLASELWCRGARAESGSEVPIGLMGVSGNTLVFLDPWIPRRERMDEPARRYWQWRMRMRPWNAFLAQVLQFQCQLRDSFAAPGEDVPSDSPCREAQRLIREATRHIESLETFYRDTTDLLARSSRGLPRRLRDDLAARGPGLTAITDFGKRLVQASEAFQALPTDRLLIRRGIVELPSAGYLPVIPSDDLTVNQQVRRWMGEGVNLRFCLVRPDYVAHALEEAQHLDRLSLLAGLDDPTQKPDIDILVPNGVARESTVVPVGNAYEAKVDFYPGLVTVLSLLTRATDDSAPLSDRISRRAENADQPAPESAMALQGVARSETTTAGGAAFYLAAGLLGGQRTENPAVTPLNRSALWADLQIDRDPFTLQRNQNTRVDADLRLMIAGNVFQLAFKGDLLVAEVTTSGSRTNTRVRLVGSLTTSLTTAANSTPTSRIVSVSDTAMLLRDASDTRGVAFDSTLARPSLLGTLARAFSLRTSRRWLEPGVAQAEASLETNTATPAPAPVPAQPSGPSFTVIELQALALFRVTQKLNPEVLRPAHPLREIATAALEVLAAVAKSDAFATIASRKLFPPPRPIESELSLLAREDWVLFHRRRIRQCAVLETPPPAARPRVYRVYGIFLKTERQLATVQRAFAQNDGAAIDGLRPRLVTTAEFSAGQATLDSSPDDLRTAWATALPIRSRIVYAAIGSRGPALDDGETLALGRLDLLARSLNPPTSFRAGTPLVNLPEVPDALSLSAASHDGILVAVVVPTTITCHRVYRGEADAAVVKELT
ncbi:MAG: hypothetical protein IT580_24950, partial [Verrucomicrobiales bacterium]|nr:hypothetical protein [Verrucomicrobiales bacterium]